jgi:hypothetical protein
MCETCDYKCSKIGDYKRHLSTSKHKKKQICNTIVTEEGISKNIYSCVCCGITYNNRTSLWRHKKKCSDTSKIVKNTLAKTLPVIDNELIIELMKQNQEFKDLLLEQNTKMMEMAQHANTQIVNNTTNNNNNKFNLNIFLNEKCKDAMNIMDFANSLEIKLTELEDVGTLGYATGISNIIVRGLHELDIYKRPIHCSDLKRENMHVKDQNMWIVDKDKTLLETAIKRVARKNILKVKDWKEVNPEYCEINSKTMDKYAQILVEATGSFEPAEKERDFNKIIRMIAKEVVIEK